MLQNDAIFLVMKIVRTTMLKSCAMLVHLYAFNMIVQLTSSIVKMVIQKNTKLFLFLFP